MCGPLRPFRITAVALFPLLAGCSDLLEPGREAPTLEISAPTEGAVVEGDSVIVTGTATDDHEVRRITLQLGGAPEQEVSITPAPEVAFRSVLHDLPLGSVSLTVRAYDEEDRTADQALTFSTKDVRAPKVQLASPAEGDLVERDSVRITGSASDDRVVVSLSYALDDAPPIDVPVHLGEDLAFAFTLKPQPGNHALVVRGLDAGGNTGEDTVQFTTASASILVESPLAGATLDRFAAELTGRVDATTLQKVTVSVNGGPESSTCDYLHLDITPCGFAAIGGNVEGRLTAERLVNGKNSLAVFAYDAQGRKIGVKRFDLQVAVPVKRYDVSYLGTLGGDDSRGVELNEKNEVVGWASTSANVQHAFAWDGTQMVDIGASFPAASRATGVNSSGEVVGYYEHSRYCTHAFYYRIGQTEPARTILEVCGSSASDINDAGKIAVTRPAPGDTVGRVRVPFVLADGTWTALRPSSCVPDYCLFASTAWINNWDQVTGYEALSANLIFEFLFPDRDAVGAGRTWKYGAATDLNNLGDWVLDRSLYYLTQPGGALVTPSGTRDITGLSSALYSDPRAVNDKEEVAGTYHWTFIDGNPSSLLPAGTFLWMNDTNYSVESVDPDWKVDGVDDINDAGVILAHAKNTRTGQKGAVLLVPKL